MANVGRGGAEIETATLDGDDVVVAPTPVNRRDESAGDRRRAVHSDDHHRLVLQVEQPGLSGAANTATAGAR